MLSCWWMCIRIMARNGHQRALNQLNKCFFAYFICGTALTCPLDDSHRCNIWCARIPQLRMDFWDTFYKCNLLKISVHAYFNLEINCMTSWSFPCNLFQVPDAGAGGRRRGRRWRRFWRGIRGGLRRVSLAAIPRYFQDTGPDQLPKCTRADVSSVQRFCRTFS